MKILMFIITLTFSSMSFTAIGSEVPSIVQQIEFDEVPDYKSLVRQFPTLEDDVVFDLKTRKEKYSYSTLKFSFNTFRLPNTDREFAFLYSESMAFCGAQYCRLQIFERQHDGRYRLVRTQVSPPSINFVSCGDKAYFVWDDTHSVSKALISSHSVEFDNYADENSTSDCDKVIYHSVYGVD